MNINIKSVNYDAGTGIGVLVLCAGLFLVVGWIMNIAALFSAPAIAAWSGMEIARVIGVFVAPIGGILGWF